MRAPPPLTKLCSNIADARLPLQYRSPRCEEVSNAAPSVKAPPLYGLPGRSAGPYYRNAQVLGSKGYADGGCFAGCAFGGWSATRSAEYGPVNDGADILETCFAAGFATERRTTPKPMKIAHVRVHSIAIADPPLRSSYGLHAPYALRTVLGLESDDGVVGIARNATGAPKVVLRGSPEPALPFRSQCGRRRDG